MMSLVEAKSETGSRGDLKKAVVSDVGKRMMVGSE